MMDPHSRPGQQNGGGSFWSGGYGYDQAGGAGGVTRGTGASEPSVPTRPPIIAPDTQPPRTASTQPSGTGPGPAGGGGNFTPRNSTLTPVDEPSSPGSLKVRFRMVLKPDKEYIELNV